MITIVDYGLGNLGSIRNMLKKLGVEAEISGDPAVVARAEKLILPGVGAFDAGMTKLRDGGLIEPLRRRVLDEGRPILGICLGMQLLTKSSEEGSLPGLGWIDARTVKFKVDGLAEKLAVPHMGWNFVTVERESRLFADMRADPRFYFVHSYYVDTGDREAILTRTRYHVDYVSGVERDNVMGVQFHPEKSHGFGMALLRNFATAY